MITTKWQKVITKAKDEGKYCQNQAVKKGKKGTESSTKMDKSKGKYYQNKVIRKGK